MPELWDQLAQQPVAEPISMWPNGDRAPLRITVGGPTMKDGSQSSGSSFDPFNPPQVEYVGRPLIEGLAKVFGGPSWLERATEQSAKDQQAFKMGGVAGLMADTSVGQELAGGFGGTTVGKLPPFYSAAQRAVEGAKLGKGTPEQWTGYLRNQPGVKAEEMDWMFGNLPKEGMLTKEQMQAHAAENAVTLGEVVKGNPKETALMTPDSPGFDPDRMQRANPTKFSQWQLPGGENYRETLLTLPTEAVERAKAVGAADKLRAKYGDNFNEYMTPVERSDYIKAVSPSPQFKSSHWDEPNVLAHIRMNDREVPGVGKSLHLEEIQSDWHQKGRTQGYQQKVGPDDVRLERVEGKPPEGADPSNYPGYWESFDQNGNMISRHRGNVTEAEARAEAVRANEVDNRSARVPNAPFKSTWADLSLKRMIREASEKGYDAVSWTPGEAQAARYDLSKQISNINYNTSENTLQAFDKNGGLVMNSRVEPKDLPEHIGKDAADKILNSPTAKKKDRYGEWNSLSGLDLKVGGEGMKAFYDKMLVDKANALGKKHGARVEQSELPKKTPATMDEIATELGYGGWHSGLTAEQKATVNQIFDSKKMPGDPVHVLRITPQLREAAMKGFPLFSLGAGGAALAPGLFNNNDAQPQVNMWGNQ